VTQSARRDRGQLRSLLALRLFRRLLSARLASQLGDGFLQAALATFVLFSPERQATASGVALVFAALLLPYSVVGPFAGVLLDRWRRRQVLIWGNVLRALAIGIIAAQVMAGHDGFGLAIVVLVALGFNRLTLTAHAAALANTVPPHLLVTANAVAPTAGTVVSASATVAGALLRTALGGGDRGSFWVVILTVLAVLLSALLAWRIPIDVLGPHADDEKQRVRDVIAGLRDGLKHLKDRPAVGRALVVTVAHRFGFGAVLVNALLLTRNTLNAPQEADTALGQLALVGGSASVGALIGAIITPWIVRRFGPFLWPALMLAIMSTFSLAAVAFAGFRAANVAMSGGITGSTAVTDIMVLLVAAGFIVGVTATATKICADAIAQRVVHDDHRGRIFSVYDVGLNLGLMAGVTAAALAMPNSGVAPLQLAVLAIALFVIALWHARIRTTG
jgi:MFS family permease